MPDPRANSAIRAGQHVFSSYQPCVANQPLGHEVRVFDEIRTMANDTRDQGRAIWQLHFLEYSPFVLVARV